MAGFSVRRFVWAQVAFVALLVAGTIGFRAILDESWVDSFYRSVVTTTLTGLDTPPDSDAGKVFSVVLLVAGVAIFLYLAGAIVELIARGVFGGTFAERRKARQLSELRDHVIICGFGRVGRHAASAIQGEGRDVVVVDPSDHAIGLAQEIAAVAIQGDGTEDADLERAGLARAYALVACADSDEKNLFITLSARAARPDLFIVARASGPSVARKLDLAGADRVVEPYSSAGRQIATQVLKPQVAAFLDIAGIAGAPDLRFEEIDVSAMCALIGRPVADTEARDRTGAIVVAMRRADGSLISAPSADVVFEIGDVVIAVGSPEQLDALERLFAPATQDG